jgi:hypothetical protein
MNYEKPEIILHGYQSLAKVILKVIPLIESILQPLDGERVAINTGNSAKFKKVKELFQDQCEKIPGISMHIPYPSVSYSSCMVNFKLAENVPGASHCNYFSYAVYIGEVDRVTGVLKYTYDSAETIAMCNGLLATTSEQIKKAQADIKALKEQFEKARESVPYQFRDLLETCN